jgi:hypothetical protein
METRRLYQVGDTIEFILLQRSKVLLSFFFFLLVLDLFISVFLSLSLSLLMIFLQFSNVVFPRTQAVPSTSLFRQPLLSDPASLYNRIAVTLSLDEVFDREGAICRWYVTGVQRLYLEGSELSEAISLAQSEEDPSLPYLLEATEDLEVT